MSEAIEVDAGAVLLDRAAGSRCRIAIIHRTEYGDWTLPKGHVETGESLEQAAVREVREETGYDVEITGLAGAMAYENEQRAKPVTYFYARPTSGPRQGALDGVDQVLWLSYRDARRKLTHAGERRFLDRLGAEDGPLSVESELRPSKQRLRLSPRLDRVVTALDVYEAELGGLRQRPLPEAAQLRRTASGERDSTWWRSSADELLNRARESCVQRRIDSAWQGLQSSRQLSLYELTDQEITLRATSLREEVRLKLDGWRLAAAEALLQSPITWPPHNLIEAQRILDEHFSNRYLRLTLVGRRIATAAVLLAATIGLLWVAVWLDAFDGLDVDGPFVLQDGGQFGGVLLLGMFGAMLSLALDSSRNPGSRRIYELVSTQIAVPVARLSVGAGAAVLVVAATQSAIVGIEGPWQFLAAVPAGFSERIVRRSVDALESATLPDR